MIKLYLISFHIIAMVAWFAGLFYLPRLFVYHADTKDDIGYQRFCLMEYKLYYYIMWPAAIVTTVLGLCLLSTNWAWYLSEPWFHVKLLMVFILWLYQIYCGYLVCGFAKHKIQHSARFFRFFNEVPTLILIVVVVLTVVKP